MTPTEITKQVGPYTVSDTREFALADLRKIGPAVNAAGERVFVDYDGTGKEWYETLAPLPASDTPSYAPTYGDRTKTRRAVLKAMVTRRDNKRRLAEWKARRSS